MKKLLGTTRAPAMHWVGDGFPVHGLFGYNGPDVPARSPFLMLDYAAPTEFQPAGGHPLHVTRAYHAAVAGRVAVFDLAGIYDR